MRDRYAVQKQRPDGTWYTFFRHYSEAEARNKLAYEWNRDESAILRIVKCCTCGGYMHLHYRCEECHAIEGVSE
jgi:formate dehydrogenase maturation protein FdhE